MPKQAICEMCQEVFPRARALRRHLALSRCPARRRPPTPDVASPEVWETELLCSVSPPPPSIDNQELTAPSSSPPPGVNEVPGSAEADLGKLPPTPPCTILDGPETPPTLKLMMNELFPEVSVGAPRSAEAPAPSSPRRQSSVAVQADGDWFPVDRARRRIFGDPRRPRSRVHIYHRSERD